eukprot:654907-Amphidinium_carterae.2
MPGSTRLRSACVRSSSVSGTLCVIPSPVAADAVVEMADMRGHSAADALGLSCALTLCPVSDMLLTSNIGDHALQLAMHRKSP